MTRIALGLQSHARRHGASGRGLIDLAKLAEDVGFDGVLIGDHVVIGPRLDRYPYPPAHFTPDSPWLEPLTVLAAVAAVTSHVTLATGILVSPLRPAVLLAKTAATIDAIAEGRLELGVGVGWQPEEFAALNMDFEQRGQLLTDGIRVCRTLWEEGSASLSTDTVRFDDIWCEPTPASRIPVLFSGGLHRRNLERIATLGDGWVTHPSQPIEEITAGVATLRTLFEEHGRDPATVRIRTRLPVVRLDDGGLDLPASLALAERYSEAGVTDLTIFSTTITDGPDEAAERITSFGTAWRNR